MPDQPNKTMEDADLRREVERLGIRTVHETSGRWAARTDDGLVEYGTTELEAQTNLAQAIWITEGDWRNAVDADTAAYIENQDD